MDKSELMQVMTAEIKSMKSQFERNKIELQSMKRDIKRKERAVVLFLGNDRTKKRDKERFQTVQVTAIPTQKMQD